MLVLECNNNRSFCKWNENIRLELSSRISFKCRMDNSYTINNIVFIFCNNWLWLKKYKKNRLILNIYILKQKE